MEIVADHYGDADNEQVDGENGYHSKLPSALACNSTATLFDFGKKALDMNYIYSRACVVAPGRPFGASVRRTTVD